MTDHLDAHIIDSLLRKYPRKWRNKVPELDRIGRIVRLRKPMRLERCELIEISDWKAGERNRRRLPQNDETVRARTRKAFEKESDRERMRYLVSSWQGGCGMRGVGVPIGSAVLRFVFPEKYGCVDWRNWYILSQKRNEVGDENELFDSPLLPQLDDPYSSSGISLDFYGDYLRIIRTLAKDHPWRSRLGESLLLTRELAKEYPRRTPAEIDMALFSYSWVFIRK